ncbi:PREDICTED: serine incorporator 1-like isoform X2 [Amphimedon queenslandica]|uniref:Serine incorporator n=1 Tax=Amphimedon queenslandica TaxID=400682 RepID=A0A1X7VVA9_AMPQE|nr:PREDICTED: serine incorporator 1-like isoform X2 [Amphimedon queenslandica]|eukprot:XP_019851028.1 PREDICTED: serine incorporator 1-like isoform X2 [Amphimedon queenslandica]
MCCLELLCCCLGPKACGICCPGDNINAKSSITTRFMYIAFLVFVVIVSSILLAPSIGTAVEHSFLCKLNIDLPEATIIPESATLPGGPTFTTTVLPDNVTVYDESAVCRIIFGYTSVYRICMGTASFFFVMMLMMLCVFSSRDPRAYIQNGFWCIKWTIVIAIVIAFFFIPRHGLVFSQVSLVIGMIGAFIFIILQVVFLIDFAHNWAESWLDKQKETENNLWYVALLIPTIIFYLIALVGIILLFVFFVRPGGCGLNIFFLCSIFILSVAVSIIAILPPVQNAQPTSGLLQASIVALYTTYLTYSALSNEPYGEGYDCPLSSSNSTVGQVSNAFGKDTNEVVSSVIGILVMLVTVVYACVYLSNNKQLQKLRGNHKDESESALLGGYSSHEAQEIDDKDTDTDVKESKMKVTDDETEHVTYSYSFFHFMMVISILFVMMQLTNWYNPGIAESDRFQNTWASVWIKMSSAWLCFVVYLWTLLAPLILRNRDFGYGAD